MWQVGVNLDNTLDYTEQSQILNTHFTHTYLVITAKISFLCLETCEEQIGLSGCPDTGRHCSNVNLRNPLHVDSEVHYQCRPTLHLKLWADVQTRLLINRIKRNKFL